MREYLNGGSREDEARLFSVVICDRTGVSGHRRFHLNCEDNGALAQVAHSTALEIFKSHQGLVLEYLL